jgi:hypothetical protein
MEWQFAVQSMDIQKIDQLSGPNASGVGIAYPTDTDTPLSTTELSSNTGQKTRTSTVEKWD